jgi:hypothetical protein
VPVASFTASPNPALIGGTVRFDASASSDPGGNPITSYEWDLDGNGTFEVSSGSNPVLSTAVTRVPSGPVALRVTDSEGFADEVQKRFTFDGKFNFQPDNVPVPASYTKDTGSAWSDARGYGWVRQDSLQGATHTPLDLTPNTRERDAADRDQYDQRLDTLVFMQFPQNANNSTAVKTPGAWELALPCGTYTVTVSVGDSIYNTAYDAYPAYVSTHRINIEGQNAIAGFRPTNTTKFQSATKTVAVCDGRLTIDAIGGSNTKLDYVDVVPVG